MNVRKISETVVEIMPWSFLIFILCDGYIIHD